MAKKIYYIENTISEFQSSITAYFETFEEAKEGMKECADWWSEKGTGKIYEAELGLHGKRKCVYNSWDDGAVK